MRPLRRWVQLSPLATLLAAAATAAQVHGQDPWTHFRSATHLIVPQSRAFALQPGVNYVVIERIAAKVTILEQTARTALEVTVRNQGPGIAEAVVLLPVPDGAVVDSFVFEGQAQEPTAQLLPREEARRLYDSIVAKVRDPALLEFAGLNVVRSSVFPVPAGATQRLRLTYDHLLEADGNRIDYVLPRSESLAVEAPWRVTIELRAKRPIAAAYSPSHPLEVRRLTPTHLELEVVAAGAREPGPLLLSYLVEQNDDVAATLFTYPDPTVGGGYFLLLAGSPPRDAKHRSTPRDVTIVLDRSGSMAGPKMDQAKAAALQVIEGLVDGEGFRLIDYGTTVESCQATSLRKDRQALEAARRYLQSLLPGGGTNIHDALLEALRVPPIEGMLPIVLFLTDGIPTIGPTSELQIRDQVAKGNPFARRVFTFGVGHDVNVPLLDWIADHTRATVTYVLPQEDVEVKVAQVFQKLYGPVLATPKLVTLDADGNLDPTRTRELQPARLPDLFANDQLVVLGQYQGASQLRFRLEGSGHSAPQQWTFDFTLDKASTRNAFVPRLWASRRIAYLIDQVRQLGAQPPGLPLANRGSVGDDPRVRELRDEILRLSTRFGILSEYTAFLATEGTALQDWATISDLCAKELDGKAVQKRWGIAAVNQGQNLSNQKLQTCLNNRNGYLDDQLNRVEVSTVQQLGDCAFFRRGTLWVDGRIVLGGDLQPTDTVRRGTEQHRALFDTLLAQHRNAILSLAGEVLVQVDGKNVLVVND